MTRKDYQMLADILNHNLKDFVEGEDGFALIGILAHQMATALQADNPRFDRARFLDACGVK